MLTGGTMVHERYCTVLMNYDKATPPNEDEIREELESKDVEKKVSGLKTLVSLLLNGEVMPKLLMTVIRFCVPCEDHKVKKLLLVYWEVVEKTGPDGKLLPEMILVTNNLRKDLEHANEYIRGCTLRFICKLKEVSAVPQCCCCAAPPPARECRCAAVLRAAPQGICIDARCRRLP
jgi:coatomer subunit beta